MDRCDSHTQSDHLATATLPGERIISAFHVKCALMKAILFSAAENCTAASSQAPLYVLKEGEMGHAAEKGPVACGLLAHSS